MTLGEKLRCLREAEGALRGMGRAMTQSEVSRAIRTELGATISQAYLSQVENGRRNHLTDQTRTLLSRLFNVHPGYLVSDPEGFRQGLISGVQTGEGSLDEWLMEGAARFSNDVAVSDALQALARDSDSRKCLLLLASVLRTADLRDRLFDALHPAARSAKGGQR